MDGTKGVEDRETLIGKATGTMVMVLFGLLWAVGCAGTFAGALVPILLASGVAVTAILVAAALRLRRAAAGRPSGGCAPEPPPPTGYVGGSVWSASSRG